MKKKWIIALLILALLAGGYFVYNSVNTIGQGEHGGLDFNKSGITKVSFKVYHSKTADHKWEQVDEFSFEPREEFTNYVDIFEKNGFVYVTLFERETKEIGGGLDIIDNALYQKKFDYNDFSNNSETTKKPFIANDNGIIKAEMIVNELKVNKEEQFYGLIPIGSGYFCAPYSGDEPTLNLEEPYDEEEGNIDNILVSVTIEK